jgi:hypothetical protein
MSNMPPMRPRMHTMAYSMVDSEEAKKRHGGSAPVVDTTVEMYAVVDSVKTVISDLIERNVDAWKVLPQAMKDKLIAEPHKFRFVWDQAKCGKDGPPKIIYNGVMIWFSGQWLLDTLVDDQ